MRQDFPDKQTGAFQILLFLLCIRNMVVALKELSIRGDFRTTIEYLVMLLDTRNFQNNEFDTAWLDVLISEKVQVWFMAVIGLQCISRLEVVKC